ncbi:MAG: hypothetical protein KDH20_10615 [Rhodocyclaceae bacterium]|nr:hypothetical protein [Rhodocyclaceae bacterium]
MRPNLRDRFARLSAACLLSGACLGADAAEPSAAVASLTMPAMPASDASPRRVASAGRAYAIDGGSFFFEGIPIQVDRLSARPGLRNEHARQRLQAVLDAGEVTLDGRTDPVTGFLRADVWVDGRPIADWLDGIPPSAALND